MPLSHLAQTDPQILLNQNEEKKSQHTSGQKALKKGKVLSDLFQVWH